VEDEGGWKGGGGLGAVGFDEAAGQLDDGADAVALWRVGRGGAGGGETEGEEAAERDAEEGDARGIDGGLGGDVVEGVVYGGEPLGDVDAVGDAGEVGAGGGGAVEVVGSEEGDADSGEERRETA
jgi:hypothetical protein